LDSVGSDRNVKQARRLGVLQGRQHPLRERPPGDRHHQPEPARTGAKSSPKPSSPPPSWTASHTSPSCSTSAARHGASENTPASRSPPPNPANLTAARPGPDHTTRI